MNRRRRAKKAKAQAKQPPIRKSAKNSGGMVRDLKKRLAEVLEQQTATSEILRVISNSPSDHQPVFDTIVRNAGVVCGAADAILWTVDGDELVVHAHHGPLPARMGARQPIRGSVAGYAVHEARVIHIEDVTEADDFPVGRDVARRLGWRTVLGAPLLLRGLPIGAILIRRREVHPFTTDQISLLETFADQAVIAIENVRLFKELQASNRELRTALDTQTATGEILRVISSSPTDVQPVFDTIVRSALKLCDGFFSIVYGFDGEIMTVLADHQVDPRASAALRSLYPAPARRDHIVGRALLECRVSHVADVPADPELGANRNAFMDMFPFRTALAVPMLRDGTPIGAIAVGRADMRPFSDTQIDLLQTFADQAVIAIENARLFNETKEALERQTATSAILDAISQSQMDTQPVFEAIADSALRLFRAWTSAIHLVDGESLVPVAIRGRVGLGEESPAGKPTSVHAQMVSRTISRDFAHGRSVVDRAVVHVADLEADADAPRVTRENGRRLGFRAALVVPLLKADRPIGSISVTRAEPGRFSDVEIALLTTFADQAVIAIENVRLFKELQARTGELTRSVEQLTALGAVARAVSSTLDLETVLNTIVARAVQLAGARSGTIWEYDAAAEEFVLRITQNVEDPELLARRDTRVRRGEGAVGQLAVSQRPVHIPDITHEGAYEGRLRDSLVGVGTRALLAIPLLHEDRLLGGLVMSRRTPGEFPTEIIDLLSAFATHSALAIENARLFREIEMKSRQLEAASQHKSEFLANMSHELRTPLNAIIGFSEILAEKMFGDINEKQTEYLQDILESGRHLLSLINDILDLSKIEAGRMELELAEFDLPTAIDNALILVRERASRRGIRLGSTIDERLGTIDGDERKVKQVLLNLLSNALKFTPEGGRIDVSARAHDGVAEVSVTDTGVGIAPEDQEAVFEEFRQVGTADKKVEGTGLGLALSRKFIELHGGRIWVKSQVGMGSTFTFTIPELGEPSGGGVTPTLVS